MIIQTLSYFEQISDFWLACYVFQCIWELLNLNYTVQLFLSIHTFCLSLQRHRLLCFPLGENLCSYSFFFFLTARNKATHVASTWQSIKKPLAEKKQHWCGGNTCENSQSLLFLACCTEPYIYLHLLIQMKLWGFCKVWTKESTVIENHLLHLICCTCCILNTGIVNYSCTIHSSTERIPRAFDH